MLHACSMPRSHTQMQTRQGPCDVSGAAMRCVSRTASATAAVVVAHSPPAVEHAVVLQAREARDAAREALAASALHSPSATADRAPEAADMVFHWVKALAAAARRSLRTLRRSARASMRPFQRPSTATAASFRLNRLAATLRQAKNARAAACRRLEDASWSAATCFAFRRPKDLALAAHARNVLAASCPLASSIERPPPLALPRTASCWRMLDRLLRRIRCTAPAPPRETIDGAPPVASRARRA